MRAVPRRKQMFGGVIHTVGGDRFNKKGKEKSEQKIKWRE